MPNQQTVVIIKPDGIMMGEEAVTQIVGRYLKAGLRILQEEGRIIPERQVRELYREHEGKFFFNGLVLAMTSGPSLALLLEGGEDTIEIVRKLNGATNPEKAEPGTIRHDFRSAGGPFNTVHASDSPDAAAREITIVFSRTS